ncbi:MAG: ABC transporter ATP-binding protein [Chloroflexi bacterium]|nr:ABC transporter ATP-binding protein [Chloroflexota bacterium]
MFKKKALETSELHNDIWQNIRPGEVLLEARGITKRYPGGVLANDAIHFEIEAGEIHAVLGENGAGKTTLMSILFGLVQPDEGEIRVRGRPVRFRSPEDAIKMGIGMVHQHRKLVPAHSVLENILLGHPKSRGVIKVREAEEEIVAIAERYGFKVDPRARVWQLTEGEKQVVEIVKALYRGAKILILDEPTSALTPVETERLLESIETMTQDALGVVPFITHKLPMVLAISDQVTILRRGKVVDRLSRAVATEQILAQKMVGRPVIFDLQRPDVEPGEPVIHVQNLSARNNKGFLAVKDVSFTVREGEILGIAGVAGNGQHELAETLFGMRPAESGHIFFQGRDITQASILERWKLGMGYTPAERTEVGSIGDFSLTENVAMNYYFDARYNRSGFLDYRGLRRLTEDIIAEYDVVAPSPEVKIQTLSGGNLQKIILGRVLSRRPKLLIANLPAQGLDVGATEFVQRKLLEARSHKAAVILISEDLDEILSLSDWVAPMYEGEIVDILPAAKAKKDIIGAMIAGLHQEN